jgi:hypothetical protein
VVFLFSSVTWVGVAEAHGKITATGHIACSSFVGSVKFSPPLLSGGSFIYDRQLQGHVERLHRRWERCRAGGHHGRQDKRVGRPANEQLRGRANDNGTDMTIKWSGPHPITPSVIVAPKLDFDTVDPGNEFFATQPENPPGDSFMVSGSFAGVSQGAVEAFFDHEAAIATGCQRHTGS